MRTFPIVVCSIRGILQNVGDRSIHRNKSRPRRLFAFKVLLLTTLPLLIGCFSIPTKHGTHHVIIGFGIVTVSEEEEAIVATDTQSFGISISDRPGLKLGVGYCSNAVISVAEGARDVRVEVYHKPAGPIIMDVHNVELEKKESQEKTREEGGSNENEKDMQ